MPNASTFYRKKLPHLQPVGGTFFVTFRLKGSIPKQKVEQLLIEQAEALRIFQLSKPSYEELSDFYLAQLFAFDELLDKIESGPHHLKQADISQTVAQKIESYNGQYYDLLAYCIMSNHVHILIDTSVQLDENGRANEDYKQLNRIMQLIKGGSAREANKIRGTSGAFWEIESYDHWVRNQKSLTNIFWYILNNPVKAGLVKDWRDWRFSFGKYTRL